MNEKIEARVQELAGLVKYHADLYYNKARPEITDAEYDSLVDELKALVEQLRIGAGDGDALAAGEDALSEVGAVPTYGRKVAHSSIMGSLEKENTPDAIVNWADKHGVGLLALTPKIDGLAARLNYRDGKLVQAATRGDGMTGQDVTDNVRRIKSVPLNVPGFTGEVRVEVYMKRSVFQALSDSGERVFANPRNAAAGSLMAKDPEVTGRRNLSVYVHSFIVDGVRFKTERENHNWMRDNLPGLEPVPVVYCTPSEFAGHAAAWEAKRSGLDYEIDGLVAAFDSIEAQEEAGWNGRRPNGKMAYKFRPEQKTAKLLAIDWQVGRLGRLTPVARIEPTPVSGSVISNLTLHNAANVKSLDIAVGDEVLIEKAGEIIPQVVRVMSRTGRKVVHVSDPHVSVYPSKCPSCGGPVEYDEKEVNLWCRNPACPAKLEARILHWLRTLDVKGVGEGIVAGLCGNRYVADVPDLYYVTREQMQAVTGGESSAENAIQAILEKATVPLAVFLDGLGIDGLGTTTGKLVAKKFKTLEMIVEIAQRFRGDLIMALMEIEGIGDITANKIVSGLAAMSSTIDRLAECLDIQDVVDAAGPLAGMSFVLTGAMSKPRKEIEKAIEKAGGEMKSSVGRGVTYLVQADASSTSSKSEKAKSIGTKILAEADLWKMMEV